MLGDDLDPADGLTAAGRGGEDGGHRVPGQLRQGEILRREPRQRRFFLRRRRGVDALVDRVAQLAREVLVQLARIAARLRRHLRREQPQQEAVLVGHPRRSVEPQERGAGALLAAEAQGAVEQPAHEVLEADRHLDELPSDVGSHAIDHAAAHDGLAHRRVRAPARPVAEQIRDAHGQIVVGIEEPGAPGHDAVAVGVGVIGEGEIEAVAERR